MRELLLLRHAKSSWDDPSLDDFDRPLAPRGEKAAPWIGREMAALGWIPEMALVSPAQRARQTWELVAREIGEGAPAPQYERALYMVSAEQLLGIVRAVPDTITRLLVVGHNPGLEELARGLAGPESKSEPLSRLRKKFPTAAVARFAVEGSWSGLDLSGARLTHFVRPVDLSPG